jgi:hypothetical protein
MRVPSPIERAMFLGLLHVPASPGSAQVRVELRDDDFCRSCRVEVALRVTLGKGEGLPGRPYANTIATDSQGRFFLGFPETTGEPVWVFDRDGRIIRKLGRSGFGPGEFREVRTVRITPGDTLRVYDGSLGRVTVYSPALELVRTEPASAQLWDILWLEDGSVVINAEMRSAPRVGLPLHLVTREGRIKRSFGEDDVPYSPRNRRRFFRWLSAAPGGFWSTSYTNTYKVQRFDTSGRELARLERRAAWFPPTDEYWFPSKDRPPASELWGALQSTDSVLWVVARRGDETWHRGLSAPIHAEGRTIYPWASYEKVFDSVIEAVGVPEYRLLGSRRFDGVFFSVFGNGLAAMIRESPDGEPFVEIYQLRLRRL